MNSFSYNQKVMSYMAMDTATPASVEFATPTEHSALQRWLLISFFAYLAFVIYGSLVPLQYIPISFEQALQQFSQIRYLDLGIESRADWVANILLFVPLTFLLAAIGFKAASPVRNTLLSLFIMSASVGLAMGIEFTQLYFPQRTVSINDILAESLGALGGIVLYAIYGTQFKQFLLGFAVARGQASVQFYLLVSYSSLFFIYNILPLDLTLSPVELYDKWQDGRLVLVPFSSYRGSAVEVIYAILSDIALWLPITVLWLLHKPQQRSAAFYSHICLFAVSVEFCQLFVYSRITDVSDIFCALIAAYLASRTVARWRKNRPDTLYASSDDDAALRQPMRAPLIWGLMVFGYSCFLMLLFWYPFDFNFDRSFLSSRLHEVQNQVLFQAMYFGSEYRAITALTQKLLTFIPLGIFFAILRQSMQALWQRKAVTGVAVLYFVLFAGLVEGMQLALASKSVDMTDWLLKIIGAVIGFKGYAFIVSRTDLTLRGASDITDAVPNPVKQSTMLNSGINPWLMLFLHLFLTLFVIGFASQLSMLPYNLRELLTDNNTALFGIALSLYVMTLPLLLRVDGLLKYEFYSPLFVIAQSSLIFFLLYFTVPVESLHDILGSPVSDWPASLELLLRFIGFFALIQFNCLFIIRLLNARQKLPLMILWICYSLALAFLWDLAVVKLAGTDNITELLADGGGFVVALTFNLYLALLFGCAAYLGSSLVQPSKRRFAILSIVVPLAIALSWSLINNITENVILKYDQAFSALQFLLSSDRSHYAQPDELFIRYSIGYVALLTIFAWFYLLIVKLQRRQHASLTGS